MLRVGAILLAVSVAAGLGLGLYLGWIVIPVEYVDTHPRSLQQAYKDDYVLMVATSFAGDGDLEAARARMAVLEFADPGEAVRQAAGRMRDAGYLADDLRRLYDLADALQGRLSPAREVPAGALDEAVEPSDASPAD
jgi:hypothetical protein